MLLFMQYLTSACIVCTIYLHRVDTVDSSFLCVCVCVPAYEGQMSNAAGRQIQQIDRQLDRETNRKTDGKTDRQTYRQSDI